MNAIVKVVTEGRQRRRRHSEEFKAEVVRACRRRGVSIAAVALANGLNANLVRRWVDAAERADAWRGTLVCDDYGGYRRCSPRASPKPGAWRTHGASSKSCG